MFKLLIVDDNLPNIQFLGNILKGQFSLTFATGGQEALNILENTLPDLILLDIMMPGIDGFEVCRRLRNNEKTKSIPVIFLSAKNDRDSVIKGMNMGAQDYLIKPFSPETVLDRIQNILNHKNEAPGSRSVRSEGRVSPVFHEVRRANDRVCFEFFKKELSEEMVHIEGRLNPLVGVIPNLLNYTKDLEDFMNTLAEGKMKEIKAEIDRIQNERLDPEITAAVHTLHDNLQDIQFSLIDFMNACTPDIKEYSGKDYMSLNSFLDSLKEEIPSRIGIHWETVKEILLPDRPAVLRQMILSLVDNALDSLRDDINDGDCSIRISLDVNILCISVTDKGQGIDEELAVKMSQRRYSTKGAGRGGGIQAVRYLIKEHFQGELKIIPGIEGKVSLFIPLK